MAINDIVQTVAEARVDARSLSEFVFKPAGFKVARRLAPTVDTLDFYLNRFDSINSTYTQSVNTVNNAVSQAQQSVIAADALIAINANTAAQAVEAAIDGVAIDANLVNDALMTTVPIAGTLGSARTQRDKNREHVSVMDFFTQAERVDYATNGVSFDAKRPLQEFFDYICANDVGTAYCSGAFGVSDGLLLGGVNGGKTKNIVGNFSLELSTPSTTTIIDYLLKVQVPSLFWSGEIGLFGVGGVFYDRRRINKAIVIGGEYYATHSHFTSINVDGGFRYFGVLLDNVTTGSRIDKIRIKRVGSGLPQDGYSLLANYSNRVDAISAGSAQSSTFTVDVLPPDDLNSPSLAVIAGRVHLIKSIDRTASTITTQTLVDIGVESGNLRYVFGAGVMTRGGDASVLRIGKINCSYGSIAYWSGALYPAIVDNITAQHNFIGLMIGLSTTAAHVGGQINGLYCEWHDYYIFRLTKYPLTMLIGTTYAFDMSKVGYGYDFRNTDSNIRTDGNLDGIAMQIDGQLLTSEYDNAPAGAVDVTSLKRSKVIKVGATATFNISAPNLNMLKAYGFSSRQVVQYRSAASSSAPTSSSFNAPAGYTVNEQAQVTFTGFVGNHALYDVILDEPRKNFLVVRLATY